MSLIKEKKKKHGSEGKKQLPTWAEVSLIRPESFTFRHLMSGKSFKPEFFAPLLCVPGFSQVRKCNPPKHISELLKNENCVWWWQQRVLTHRLVFFIYFIFLLGAAVSPPGSMGTLQEAQKRRGFLHKVHQFDGSTRVHAYSPQNETRLKRTCEFGLDWNAFENF